MYVTPAGLVERFGAVECTQLASKEAVAVPPELLVLTIEAGDRSAYSEEEIDAADRALARLNRMCQDATDDIDLYVGARYTLPLVTQPPSLTRAAADLARFRLYDDNATEEVRQRYRDAIRMLEQISSGTLSLVAATPPTVVGKPEFSEGGRTFTSDSLRHF